VEIRVNTTKFYAKDGGEIEVKSAEWGKHRPTCEHDVKMADNVKSIMKKDIHPGVSDTHTTNTAGHEKKNKGEREQERKLHSERAVNGCNASMHNFCCSGYRNHNG